MKKLLAFLLLSFLPVICLAEPPGISPKSDGSASIGSPTHRYKDAWIKYGVIASTFTGDGSGITGVSSATYATNAGTAAWASAGAWPTASGDMLKSVYDPNDDGIVSTAAVANSLNPLIVATYEGVRSGTSTYAVSAGTSSWSVMGGTSSWAINSGTSSWSVFGGTSAWATYAGTSSWATNAADQAERAARASGVWTNEGVRAGTASYAVMGGTTAWAVNAGTATWATAGAWPTSTTDADVRISTGLIQIQLDAVALSTGAILTLAVSTGILQADLATEVSDRGIADGVIGVATATLRTDFNAEVSSRTAGIWTNEGVRVGTATYSVNSGTAAYSTNSGTATWATNANDQAGRALISAVSLTTSAWTTSVTNIGVATASIRSDLNAVILSTGVHKLIAGTNITLSPAGGQGDVTVTASGGGASGVSTGTISKSIVITNPATAATEYSIFRAGSALKVTALHLLCRGNVITGRFMAQNANGGSGAGIDGATVLTGVVDTNVNDDGSLSAPNIDPGNYIGFRVDTITGSPTQIIATIDYHERVAGE